MSLLSWYPLIKDYKNYGLDSEDLTVMGTVPFSDGKLGNAATYTNAPSNCLNRTGFKLESDFSWACWVKVDAETSSSVEYILSEGRDVGSMGINIQFQKSTKTLLLQGTGVTQNFITDITYGTWYHLAFTCSTTGYKGYVNGNLVFTTTSFTTIDYAQSADRFVIGKMAYNYTSTGSYFPFYGQVQDVRIYDHVLSVKEIKELAKGLVMHLPLDWGDSTRNPESSSANYTALDFGTKYLTDCSGFNNPVSAIGSNNTACSNSPRYLSGTTCGASSCINLGQSIKLQPPFSFAFWFNTSNLAYGSNRLISCTESGGWNVEGASSSSYGTGLDFVISAGSYRHLPTTKTQAELVNGWHHIVCTYDGLKSQVYIDGVLDVETTYFTTFTNITYNASNAVLLGGEATRSSTTGQTYAVPTSFSDFRFYASILSAEDVQQVYKIPFSIDHTGKFYGFNLTEV